MKNRNHLLATSLTAFLAAVLFFSFTTEKKQWTLVKSVKTTPTKSVSIDRYFNIYTADDKGNIYKFDSLGTPLQSYSPLKKADVTLMESWRTVNVFVFYRQLQEYAILDRFLTTSNSNFKFRKEIESDEKSVGFARLATLASDNNLWVFDDQDFSLKKYDTRHNKVLITTPLELVLNPEQYDLTHIREYQNLLFINDKNSGILIFDNLGNYKNKLDLSNPSDPQKKWNAGISYFNFLDNYLYFITDNALVMYDIYKGETKLYSLPPGKEYQYILLARSTAYLFNSLGIDIYSFDFKE